MTQLRTRPRIRPRIRRGIVIALSAAAFSLLFLGCTFSRQTERPSIAGDLRLEAPIAEVTEVAEEPKLADGLQDAIPAEETVELYV